MATLREEERKKIISSECKEIEETLYGGVCVWYIIIVMQNAWNDAYFVG